VAEVVAAEERSNATASARRQEQVLGDVRALFRPERGERGDRLVAALLARQQLAAGPGAGLEELAGDGSRL
jgi:hypothetical protein